jgi:hypothetical protein
LRGESHDQRVSLKWGRRRCEASQFSSEWRPAEVFADLTGWLDQTLARLGSGAQA